MNYTSHLVSDYAIRLSLSKLGYQFNSSDISFKRAVCFTIIGAEIAKLNNESMEKERAKAKAGRK